MQPTEILLSPKDLAAAIGASESSLRRWIDSGDIRVSRTAGGHRRIPLTAAVQFIRKMGALVVRPEVLNLPPLPATMGGSADADQEALFAALRDGDRDLARGLVISWYLAGRGMHEIFDGPLRGALHQLGELWKHDERGILIEHRATEMCLAMITSLRLLLAAPAADAPLAMGGAPVGDPYQIPSKMAAAVLAGAGMAEMNFGADTPLELLANEAVRGGARLVWLSISVVDDQSTFPARVESFAARLSERKIDLVIGGHASAGFVPRAMSNVHAINSMGELAAFARERVKPSGQ